MIAFVMCSVHSCWPLPGKNCQLMIDVHFYLQIDDSAAFLVICGGLSDLTKR